MLWSGGGLPANIEPKAIMTAPAAAALEPPRLAQRTQATIPDTTATVAIAINIALTAGVTDAGPIADG